MSDPRFTDQRPLDARNTDLNVLQPAAQRDVSTGGIWGWVAGFAVVALIAFVVIAGWSNSGTNNAASTTPPASVATGSNAPVRNVTPPATTGSGTNSTLTNPSTPNPATPNAAPSQQ